MTDINTFAKKVEADLVAVDPTWATFPFGTEDGILSQYDAIPNGEGTIIYYYPKTLASGQVVRSTTILKTSGESLPSLGDMPVIPEPVPPPADGTSGNIWFGPEEPEFPLETPFWWDTEDGELRVYFQDVDSSEWVDINKDTLPISPIHYGPKPPEDIETKPIWVDTEYGDVHIWYEDVNSTAWISLTRRTAGGAGGSGDMLQAVYDPAGTAANVYDTDNHISGTTNKVFTATNQSKLTGIEDNATADQTALQIKTAYESNADTNAFTNTEKTLLSNQSNSNTGDQDLSNLVDKTTAQTVNGVKTFGSFPVTPTALPTDDYQVANKKFVDDSIAALPGGSVPTESFVIAIGDEATSAVVATGLSTFRIPYAFTITEVKASCTIAPTGSVAIIDINVSGVSIMSTTISIDATEKTSKTAITQPVLTTTVLADDVEISIDIDQIGSTIAGAGYKVYIIGNQ